MFQQEQHHELADFATQHNANRIHSPECESPQIETNSLEKKLKIPHLESQSLQQEEETVQLVRRLSLSQQMNPTNVEDPFKYSVNKRTVGQIVADFVASFVGSWKFLIMQSCLLLFWITWNASTAEKGWAWDPYPFILLNLMLSFQAAYTAPVIMMSQNRAGEIDRLRNSDLHEKVDQLRITELWHVYHALNEQSAVLERMLKLIEKNHVALREHERKQHEKK